jgi:hypothetical protein
METKKSLLPLPSAAAGRNQGFEIGMKRPSAFSSQLPNKHCEHTFDIGGLLYQLFIVIWLNQFQIACEKKLILQLACRASRDITKPCQLSIAASSASFGNIGWNRSACSSNLCRQPIGLGTGKRGCDPIEIERQLMRFLPHFQLPEVLRHFCFVLFIYFNCPSGGVLLGASSGDGR